MGEKMIKIEVSKTIQKTDITMTVEVKTPEEAAEKTREFENFLEFYKESRGKFDKDMLGKLVKTRAHD